MKITQYSTNAFRRFGASELRPALPMPELITAAPAKEPIASSFLGFGVALTGSSCYLLNAMEPDRRRELLDSVYSDRGLALSVGRLTVASSDYSAELYSYDDVKEDRELRHFSVERDRAYILPMLRQILAVRPLFLFASPWSPPGWMKTGGSMCGGFMREEYLDCYADYLVRYLLAYREEGIPIFALTPQNEPLNDQFGRMPACIWHPDTEARFVLLLRKKLRENGLSPEIWINDHAFNEAIPRVLWQLGEYPELSFACEGAAFHYYAGSVEQTAILRERYPRLALHFTEGGPRLQDHYGTDWCKWAIMIIKALEAGYSSFTGWNLLLDETGGPNIGPFTCGGLVTLDSRTGELSYSGQYHAFRHFSPYIRPGARIYPLDFANNLSYRMFSYPKQEKRVEGCFVRNADGEEALFLVNPNETKRQISFLHRDTPWYIELLPDTVATVLFR